MKPDRVASKPISKRSFGGLVRGKVNPGEGHLHTPIARFPTSKGGVVEGRVEPGHGSAHLAKDK